MPTVLNSYSQYDSRENQLKRRLEIQKRIMQQHRHSLTSSSGRAEGALGELIQKMAYDEHAIAFKMMWNLLFTFGLQIPFALSYGTQLLQYEAAVKAGIGFDPKNAWDRQNVTIYKIDQSTGKPGNEAYGPGEEIPRETIRANGYIPPASFMESLEIVFADYKVGLYGQNVLNEHEKSLIGEVAKQADNGEIPNAGANAVANPKPRPAH